MVQRVQDYITKLWWWEGGERCSTFDWLRNMSRVACSSNTANFWFCNNVNQAAFCTKLCPTLSHIPFCWQISFRWQTKFLARFCVISEEREHAITSSGNAIETIATPWYSAQHTRYPIHSSTNPFSGRRWSKRNTRFHQVSIKFIFGRTCILTL